MRARRPVLLGIAVALMAAFSAPSSAAAASDAAAQKLAAQYVPIAMLREETDPPCETSAEQYQPTSVGTVLNPAVTLEREELDGKLVEVTKAPSAADVAGLPEGYYLNLPGTPLGNTCIYAKDFRRLLAEGKAPTITYAHIARETGHTGFVCSTGSSGTSTSSTTSTRATGRGCSSASKPKRRRQR